MTLDPKNARAHYGLALTMANMSDYAKAVDEFEVVQRLRGEDPAVSLTLIGAAFKADQTARALEVATATIASHAQDPKVLFNLALLLAQNAQYDQAAKLFSRVNQLRPRTPEVLYNLGVAEHNLKHLDAAAAALAEAADLKPELTEAHLRLGLIASERLNHENAIVEFQHCIDHDPKHAQYYYMLGREQFALGRWEQVPQVMGKRSSLILSRRCTR